jgi:hypothetical protein
LREEENWSRASVPILFSGKDIKKMDEVHMEQLDDELDFFEG